MKAAVVAVNRGTEMFIVDCGGDYLLIEPCGADAEEGDVIIGVPNGIGPSVLFNATSGVLMPAAVVQKSFSTLQDALRHLASMR